MRHGISSKHWQKSTDYIWFNRRNTEHWMLSSCPINNKTIKLIIKFLLNWDLVDFIGWGSVWKYGVCFFSSSFFLMCCIQSIWNLPCRFLPYCLREKTGKKNPSVELRTDTEGLLFLHLTYISRPRAHLHPVKAASDARKPLQVAGVRLDVKNLFF